MTPLNSGRWRVPRVPLVLSLVIALPVAAVIAGLATLAISLRDADPEMPASYHHEGPGLEREEALLAAAQRSGIGAELRLLPAAGNCQLRLRGAQPATLQLQLTHPTNPTLDRVLLMQRQGALYVAPCAALPVAHWWIAVRDPAGAWLLRTRAQGDFESPVEMGAPAGPP